MNFTARRIQTATVLALGILAAGTFAVTASTTASAAPTTATVSHSSAHMFKPAICRWNCI